MACKQFANSFEWLNGKKRLSLHKKIDFVYMRIVGRLMLTMLCSVFALLPAKAGHRDGLTLNGSWEILQSERPDGTITQFPQDNISVIRIYDDSCYYTNEVISAPNGILYNPIEKGTYTLARKGADEYLYFQSGHVKPLTVVDDSTIVIQQNGIKLTMKITEGIKDPKFTKAINALKNDDGDIASGTNRYVFSHAERKLKRTNHTLMYIIFCVIIALVILSNYAINLQKNKKRIEKELRQIEEERRVLPEPVRVAMNDVEDDFRRSDYYITLRKRITNGERLSKEEWDTLEDALKHVYPRFTSTLFNLHKMSQTEYQVCLLLKLEVPPSEIAAILCKDSSTISTIRSRLYQKVFGKKGGSKDWDEFISTL